MFKYFNEKCFNGFWASIPTVSLNDLNNGIDYG